MLGRLMGIGRVGCLVLALCSGTGAQLRGYRLRTDRVEVSTRTHWQAWKYPSDVIDITADGTVLPRFLQAPTNAVLDAGEFTYEIPPRLQDQYDNSFEEDKKVEARGGIKKVGSRSVLAGRILDGSAETFWEPDAADPVESWWIEIDLGRVVSATRVVVRFAEDRAEARADPFLQFRVHSAAGLSPFGQQDQSGALDYALVGGTTQPNRDQRVFAFELEPLGKYAEGWNGRLLQYLRIAATASRRERAEQIPVEEYQTLSGVDRGAVDYVWRIAGEERLVTPERYAELPQEQRGEVRYFRRERPKLAEVEVWTVGENLSLRLLDRGGSLQDVNPNSFPERAFDGSMRTDWFGLVYRTIGETAEWGLLTVDLGAQFWVEAVRILSRTPKVGGGENLLFGYLLRGSDGSLAPDGSLIWDELSIEDRQQNLDRRLFEDRFVPRKLRFLEFRNLDIARRTRAHLGDRVQSVVTEIQIFGRGYPPQLTLNSDIIELGGAKNLTHIEWEAETPPGTAVEIRTRTGDELREVHYYFKSDGNQVSTREEYDKLPSFFKGPIVTEILPGQGWSNWSQPYESPGEEVRSPSPRRYLMIQARLLSTDPEVAAKLKSVQVHFTEPVAESVVGEIEPKRVVAPGEITDFEIFIRPRLARTDPGIDRIRVVGPSRTIMELRGVGLGDDADFRAETAEEFTRRQSGFFENDARQALEVKAERSDTLEVRLPRVLRSEGALVRLSFQAQVFQSGSVFQAAVGNSNRPDVWQRVDGGEAVDDALSKGSGLTVATPVSGRDIKVTATGPLVFTPNGDGRNDDMVFAFSVFKINAAREVAVELFDLAGRPVRRLAEIRVEASGLYRMTWDGRDESGVLVPPGLYLANIRIASDKATDNAVKKLVGVVY